MKEFDKKTLETAIIYVKRLAEGNNPINNQPMEEDTVLNNPNVIRCMYFVKDVLDEVYKNGGVVKSVSRKQANAIDVFPKELLAQYEYREDKTINNIMIQLYEPVKDTEIRRITGKMMNDRLLAAGFITEIYSEEFKANIKVPTEKGFSIGMRSERMEYYAHSYMAIMYNKQAQEFLIANFEKIINGEAI